MTLDLKMPGLNGYEVMKRAKKFNHKVAIIVITAVADPEMEGLLKEQGASEIFYKPVDLGTLRGKIQELSGYARGP